MTTDRRGVQEADIRHRLDDGLTVEREDEAQGSVRGWVLRPKVERPEEFLRVARRGGGVG